MAEMHVCRRWRYIIFGSPRRLDLHVFCTYGTSVRNNLSCWPAFPIIVDYYPYSDFDSGKNVSPDNDDNVIAALEHPDCVCYIEVAATNSLLENVATVMQEPFPALTLLRLSSNDEDVPSLPNVSLGGSAPSLQEIYLVGIPFLTLPSFCPPDTSSFSNLTIYPSLATFHRGDNCLFEHIDPTQNPVHRIQGTDFSL